MTNYEYIKSMTIDKMSKMIAMSHQCGFCPFGINSYECIQGNCINEAKKFLESEHKE